MYKFSKKTKLPKAQWVKGRSKFLHIRMLENGRLPRTVAPQIKKLWYLAVWQWVKKVGYVGAKLFTKIKK